MTNKIDLNVLSFIDTFKKSINRHSIGKHHQLYANDRVDDLEAMFYEDYSYQFAVILKETFSRGYIAVMVPYRHFVWVDNDIPYDVTGFVEFNTYAYCISISHFKDYLTKPETIQKDLMTIPNDKFLELMKSYEESLNLKP